MKRPKIDTSGLYGQTAKASKVTKLAKSTKPTSSTKPPERKVAYRIPEPALAILEAERAARRIKGDRETSSYSALVAEAITTAFGKGKRGDFDEAADTFTDRMARDKKRGAK